MTRIENHATITRVGRIYNFLCTLSPMVRREGWKRWYDFIATRNKDGAWQCMNFGYAYFEDNAGPQLDPKDEGERFGFQLYHCVVGRADLTEKSVLEIGSGHGGGAYYIAKYLKPKSIIGIDFSSKSVAMCQERFAEHDNLIFSVGDAESLPFEDGTFDMVVNIESSHCYASIPTFLQEVSRVLKDEGLFTWADFRSPNDLIALDENFPKSQLEIITKRDITHNVLAAMQQQGPRWKLLIARYSPKFLTKLAYDFAGIEGNYMYENMRRRETIYQLRVARPIVRDV